jgi:hypothetical protein
MIEIVASRDDAGVALAAMIVKERALCVGQRDRQTRR